MDYLLNGKKNEIDYKKMAEVLNLIINGLPSKPVVKGVATITTTTF